MKSIILFACALAFSAGIPAQTFINGGRVISGTLNACASSGGTDSYDCPLALTAYIDGLNIQLKANVANSGAACLNVNGLGCKAIKKAAGGIVTDLATNDIRVGQVVDLVYDGTNFQMQSTLGNASAGGGSVTIQNNGGSTVGSNATLQFLDDLYGSWALADLGDRITMQFNPDTTKLALKTLAQSFSSGAKQTFQPSATTAGIAIAAGALPSAPAEGDLAVDSGDGNAMKRYRSSAWRPFAESTIAPLTDGAVLAGAGGYGIKLASVTGSGAVVLTTSPTIVTPTVASFANANHNHQNSAGGGTLDVAALTAGILGASRGGVANAFFTVAGPATSIKTFTFPNASASVLTDAALVTVAQGGSGSAGLTGLVQGNGTSAFSAIANSTTVGQTLRVTGSNVYGWGALDLADSDAVAGVLPGANVQSGSTVTAGVAEAAISSEVNTGTDVARYVTPDSLAGSNFGTCKIHIPVFDFTTALATGDGKYYFLVPDECSGMNLVRVHGQLITVSSSGAVNIDLDRCATVATGNACSGTVADMLSTNLTIDANEDDSSTAATAAVIDTNNDDISANQIIRVNVDGAGTGAAGLILTLILQLP